MRDFELVELSLPQEEELETRWVLKKLSAAHCHLAELKGVVCSIPNETILISILTLQDAKDSYEVENIVTNHDELFQNDLAGAACNPAAKEVKWLFAQFSSDNLLIKVHHTASFYSVKGEMSDSK